ncbi:transglutaminase-like domain-containing protein [Caulobacter endophyticus]|uniref:Transglutaminase family protein n=1 Tax=Caulobacter endophyticus TaxID=2172652 RepID=A0A2T9KCS7_9CAUL|nr:transglutaminase family protein [Caulobacter endophyticus]PVM93699.1 transglutaminase family protein [Caulobacter endophyticus]
MLYEVEASLTYDFAAPCEVLLQVEAADGPDQRVVSQALTFWPMMQSAQAEDPTTRQRRTIFQAFGRVNILYRAQVDILAREPDLSTLSAQAIRDLPGDVLPFLRASRYSPSDRMESFADREFGGLTGGRRVTAIVDWILKHVDYRAGVSHSATTAVDTFIDRAGVCRDFSHLLIALCRAADIPARAVSVYAWGLQPPDLHAVAEVYLQGAWRLVDATALAPIEGFVRVATGRDAADIAFMTIFGSATLVEQRFKIDQVA